ncbi:hypothetical protein [Sphingobium chlorophenolicum]|uniref:hypothetical protein n=1 Tax=Sphingobium chlorophenolicum TaxID=46429 RepID=UPI00117CCB7A|nr:hypothetical protein [Sphingobium chlorophenolicum]
MKMILVTWKILSTFAIPPAFKFGVATANIVCDYESLAAAALDAQIPLEVGSGIWGISRVFKKSARHLIIAVEGCDWKTGYSGR